MPDQYIAKTIEVFFSKLDHIQNNLIKFSGNVDYRCTQVVLSLEKFADNSDRLRAENYPKCDHKFNDVEKSLIEVMDTIHSAIDGWRKKIEVSQKGTEFMDKHERYLVVMVFGAVKTGKSSLGNFFAGKYFQRASFDNLYKNREYPVFAIEEKGREEGDFSKDDRGSTWFAEGVTDTTGAIQYFTHSGLRWVDSPGTGALRKKGDSRSMEEMVNEYIPYVDLCIFLQNSSEPGLQSDMKYIEKLSREGQEAIVVITKSDVNDEDEDDDGNIIDNWLPKTPEKRKLQEDDICKRLKETYPNIKEDKFRAISISTYLAKEAIKQNNAKLYRESNLDLFMDILGNKVSDEVIRIKEEKPKKKLNNFINGVIDGKGGVVGIDTLERDLEKILVAVQGYRDTIESNVKKFTLNICAKIRIEAQKTVREWAEKVDQNGSEMSHDETSQQMMNMINCIFRYELNRNLANIIENYEEKQISILTERVDSIGIRKQYANIEHRYTEVYVATRESQGILENIRGFCGKNYYESGAENKIKQMRVDLGTNIEDFLDDIMPKLEKMIVDKIRGELKDLQDYYFQPQENYVREMRKSLCFLNKELSDLKFVAVEAKKWKSNL